ncbi:MAG: phosphonate C-P lyase system protein PhnG [Alphaproteobacteria bacterium]|nr:phosphonate C-P lyase system protein PhnG [Alphaproteobacteria bacterium]
MSAHDAPLFDAASDRDQRSRQRWMGVLARARLDELEETWRQFDPKPEFSWMRKPETGLVMVRGRAGGTGQPFNLGEMTATRCTLRLGNGAVGVAYLKGRNRRQAELAAVFDALMQTPAHRESVQRDVIDVLAAKQAARKQQRSRKVNATKVNFFTMVRGEDPK